MHSHVVHVHVQRFADDTRMYINFYPSEYKAAMGHINEDVKKVSKYVENHNLVLIPKKSEVLLVNNYKWYNNYHYAFC